MFIFMNKKISNDEKRDAVYKHLYEMNLRQLVKEQKVITDVWKEICRETAQNDTRHILFTGNLDNYYNRLIRGQL